MNVEDGRAGDRGNLPGTRLVRLTSLRVGQRLFLALLPSLLAVALVVALSYYGELNREAPLTLVWGAGALAVVSVLITWRNTRYLASRIERLAGISASTGTQPVGAVDELDRIEQTVNRLGSALSASEAARARTAQEAESALREQGVVLAAASAAAIERLDAVRLPLHILLEAQFGELNANQEELLADARQAAEVADASLRRLRTMADADAGLLTPRREWVAVDEVVHGIAPSATAAAVRRGARVTLTLEPALPRAIADRVRLAEALAILLGAAVERAGVGDEVRLGASRANDGVLITCAPAPIGGDAALARRLLEVQGARLDASRADGTDTELRAWLPGR